MLGLISGTSMDGIDVAVAEFRLPEDAGSGPVVELLPLGSLEVAYPEPLRGDLVAALPPAECSAERLCVLDTLVGQAFADAARKGIAELGCGEVDLIASLGQTIYHWVEGRTCKGTLQLGQPAWIAEATGAPVVADLRVRDVAAGGHGAPLASLLDALWLAPTDGGVGDVAVALNIGGIANITVVGGTHAPLAYDTGPGNALLDAACRLAADSRIQYDEGGRLAANGSPHPDLLSRLLADPYYAAPPPKSTGKEHFHADYLRTALDGLPEIALPDLLATLVELTAITVADACRGHGATRVVASGGGVRNATLMASLDRHLGAIDLVTSESFGLAADAKEAYLTALLGFLTWHGLPANLPAATGASGPRVLGSITPGRRPLQLPEPAPTPPRRLRVLQLADRTPMPRLG
ncbi:anhydro-N-acetylmuramic acid kinase [Allokutzneria albata]|uniref:Anhydro-N-acetylmuramic acid kinase n=1 Tax=Allokutzneria albata TaxID=211114 RepID=A0A1G9XDX2_ALLAB|nr:anhydro-N-acetylmuramic acid kinase [Allokutzneria albata]